ncbi:calcium:proton antiporter [Pedobacter nutrimenti]|jgi:Ca2+:H+ antiporter|uniref:Ca2+:H+ antiporter n=1 Tax=Pedobacter nutrimenti TaxID=1241337 RepID=A0A318ULE3_9SPHI|nr:ionic transporter y4hA [Pedobacter nutrimenti]PYF74855.1 Ca2+:H+ antiporter [Pedobacter nutrimenti]|eukprot:gene11742-13702_t
MKQKLPLPLWTIVIPVLAWLAYFGISFNLGNLYSIVLAAGLIGSVLAAVHHAEVVAHRVGEPYGTLVLALAITIIEVALIVSLMLTGGPETAALARDTVLAAVMIILTGIIGMCLLVGGARYKEQVFSLQGVSASLVTLTAIMVLTLILPNYTTSRPGPEYSPVQLVFVAVICLVLYGTFVLVQAIRHRDFFLPPEADGNEDIHADPPPKKVAWLSTLLLLVCLGVVVVLAKALAPDIENAVLKAGAPESLVGVIIAAVVLLPEGLAAYRAAKKNRLQTSLNLALGSALASIGLTIPAVAIVSIVTGMSITLGIDMKSTVLLLLSQFTIMLSLATGKTNILQGVVLLVIFAVYLFTIIAP